MHFSGFSKPTLCWLPQLNNRLALNWLSWLWNRLTLYRISQTGIFTVLGARWKCGFEVWHFTGFHLKQQFIGFEIFSWKKTNIFLASLIIFSYTLLAFNSQLGCSNTYFSATFCVNFCTIWWEFLMINWCTNNHSWEYIKVLILCGMFDNWWENHWRVSRREKPLFKFLIYLYRNHSILNNSFKIMTFTVQESKNSQKFDFENFSETSLFSSN